MTLRRLLLVISGVSLALLFSGFQLSDDCAEMEVTVEITNTTNQEANGGIKVNVKNNIKVELNLIGKTSKDNKLKVRDTRISNLKPGKYQLFIVDVDTEKFCTKRVEVIIE